MKSTTWMYIGAVILFIMSICGIGWGGILVLGATDPNAGQSQWAPLGAAFLFIGVLMVVGGVLLVVTAVRKSKQDTVQNVTVKVDLPGETKIEQMKCQSCGGSLTADNIQLVNGAPMVNCPYCHTVYQLTEEPKW
jgi:hypothetical protein